MLLGAVMDGCTPQYEADDLGHRPIQLFRNLLVELKLRKRLGQRVIMFDVNTRGLGYFYDPFPRRRPFLSRSAVERRPFPARIEELRRSSGALDPYPFQSPKASN